MSLVLFGGVAHAAESLQIVQTEELEDFPVRGTHHVRQLQRLAAPAGSGLSSGRAHPVLLVLQEGVGHVLQRQADRGLRQGTLPPAHGALAPRLLLVPELLQAGPAEAVAALQNHGVPEDLAADGAGQLLLQHGAGARGDGPRSREHGCRRRLGTLEEQELSGLRGGTGAQRHGPRWGVGGWGAPSAAADGPVKNERSWDEDVDTAGVRRLIWAVDEQPGL